MPFPYPYQASAAPVRARRVKDKDKDARSTASASSSSSTKKPRDSSSSANRSPPSRPLRPAQPSLYTQQNLTLDQLPASPSSRTASPSTSSPLVKPSSPVSHAPDPHPSSPMPGPTSAPVSAPTFAPGSTAASDGPLLASIHLHTPAALQQYLDSEPDDPAFTPVPDAKPSPKQREEVGTASSNPPKPVGQPSNPPDTVPSHTQTLKSADPSFLRSSSPPPAAASPMLSQPQPRPGTFDLNRSYSNNPTFLGSPPPFGPTLPFITGPPNEQYYPPTYTGPPYMAMSQPATHLAELQPGPPQPMAYYPNYGPPQPMQTPLHPTHSSSIRGRNTTASRRSFSGDAFPAAPPLVSNRPDQAAQSEAPVSGTHAAEDDAVDLLHRIQNAIPDLHLLLDRYRETSGQIGVRETIIRETEAQKAAALKQKESHIERLGRELDAISSKHSAESDKLRHEIGYMEEKQKELQHSLSVETNLKSQLEADNKSLKLQKEQADKRLEEEKTAMDRDLTARKQDLALEYIAKQKALEAELYHQKSELGAEFQAQLDAAKDSWAHESSLLQTGFTNEKREIEESHHRTKRDWEAVFQSQQDAFENAQRKQLEDRESWEKEREALSRSWEEERATLRKALEEQRVALTAQHQSEKDEMQRKWHSSREQNSKHTDEVKVKMHNEIERLKEGWDADRTKFAKVTAELRSTASKLNDENVKLQKLAEAFGDVTDLKSREDPFYHDAFHHLHKQISDLSNEYFREEVGTLPSKIQIEIPKRMPPFLSNTTASIQLRAAYVEHMISTIITRRIFKPFLFTISLRRGSPDQLFQCWSENMRRKSTRKEALWRQRTLHAAYTVSSAKQSINRIAAVIVDEIVDAIKHFAQNVYWEQITAAIRKIVKIAAETWRYARLEIPMITASMTEEDRPEYMRSTITRDYENDRIAHQQQDVLLPLFPIIEREAIHEDIREDSNPDDRGYTYFPGHMIYASDPAVLERLGEMQQENVNVTSDGVGGAEVTTASPKSGLADAQGISSSSSRLPVSTSHPLDKESETILEDASASSRLTSRTREETDTASTAVWRKSRKSRSLTPPISQSSLTSTSSTGRSASTNKTARLPNWRNLGGGLIGNKRDDTSLRSEGFEG